MKQPYDDSKIIAIQANRYAAQPEKLTAISGEYWKIPKDVKLCTDLDPVERWVVSIIHQFDKGDYGVFWMSNEVLAEYVGTTGRNVQLVLKKLQSKGYITIIRPTVKDRHIRSNLKTVLATKSQYEDRD